jgi:hypothetical protein
VPSTTPAIAVMPMAQQVSDATLQPISTRALASAAARASTDADASTAYVTPSVLDSVNTELGSTRSRQRDGAGTYGDVMGPVRVPNVDRKALCVELVAVKASSTRFPVELSFPKRKKKTPPARKLPIAPMFTVTCALRRSYVCTVRMKHVHGAANMDTRKLLVATVVEQHDDSTRCQRPESP